jgi:hypothetical protein
MSLWLEVLSRLLGVVTLVVGAAGACAIVGALLTPVALIAGLGAIVGAVLTPVALTAGLGAIGFSAVGPIAGKFPKPSVTWHSTLQDILGSIAAGLQAGIGSVVAGSLFATTQSIAMGGAIPAVVTAAVAGITGIMAAAAAMFGSCFLSMGAVAVSVVGTGIGLAANLIGSLL